MKRIETDVLVIGSGGAGLYATVRAAERGVRTLLVDKGLIAKSGATVCAAGLTAVGPWRVPGDSQEAHFQDTLAGGHFINNHRLVRILTEEVPARMMELESWGLVFDQEKNGRYFLDQVSGHTYPRALARSDRVGVGIAKLLWRRALQVGVVTKAEIFVTSLLTWEGKVVGVTAIDSRSGNFVVLTAKAVVLATGGIGQLYPVTTNPVQATADGLALALTVGASLVDTEQVQFVPACLVYPESIKGFPLGVFEYAKMLDNQLQVIYDPVKLKRLTRDLLSQKIYSEIKAGRGTEHGGVYLDARGVPEGVFRNFRHEYEVCLEQGLDLRKELVEVAPAAHFFMGGIEITERCETRVPGLYAAGEVTGGVHGANRLSGNALADILVFGARAGEQAANYALGKDPVEIDQGEVDEEKQRISVLLERGRREKRPIQVKDEIRQIMWEKVGVMRSESSLTRALERFDEIERGLPEVSIYPHGLVCNRELIDYLEMENMLLVAKAIARSGVARKESRGAHHLEDHPERDDLHWLKNIVLKLENGRIKTSIKPVVTEIW